MTGEIRVDGTSQHAFLFDGNPDGIYSSEYGDGVFIDANGDGAVTVDPSSPEFLPFTVPAQVGRTIYEWSAVAQGGESLRVYMRTGAPPIEPLVVGQPAPEIEFTDLDGRTIRSSEYRGSPLAVLFWASWCQECATITDQLRAMQGNDGNGLHVIGVSFDRERQAAPRFLTEHGAPLADLVHGSWVLGEPHRPSVPR